MFPDAIDVLEGRVTVLDCNLDYGQKMSLIDALANALTEIWGDRTQPYLGGTDYPENWDQMTDNYLTFLDENFTPEMNVYGIIQAWRKHDLDFNSNTEVFGAYYDKYSDWIV